MGSCRVASVETTPKKCRAKLYSAPIIAAPNSIRRQKALRQACFGVAKPILSNEIIRGANKHKNTAAAELIDSNKR